MTPFKDTFINWLNTSFSEIISPNVKAFCFNLNYPAGEDSVKYGVELVGAGRYDKADEDWACDEVWVPTQRGILIPVSFSTNDWVICQSKLKSLIEEYFFTNKIFAKKLKQFEALAIGFVDANLDCIWVKAQ